MAGMSDQPKKNRPACTPVVLEIAKFLVESRALDVQVLDISARSGFADYFIIATLNSFGQLRGLVKNVDDQLMAHGIHARGTKKHLAEDESWVLLDCGDFIVHLMLQSARDFYALERLWFDAGRLDPLTGEDLA